MELTQERLKELFNYDPETGVFTRRVRVGRWAVGSVAGYRATDGYVNLKIGQRMYKAHRLAWLYVHGVWPTNQIDHKDTLRENNSVGNLRVATNQQNGANSKKPTGSAGLPGARLRSSGKFESRIMFNGISQYIGLFDTAQEAHSAYVKRHVELHGEFSPYFEESKRCQTTN
jgi:hypothetical protein